MDELRNRIWDYLYRLGRGEQYATIAEQLNESPEAIQMAVDCDWFDVSDGVVAIAYKN